MMKQWSKEATKDDIGYLGYLMGTSVSVLYINE